MVNCSISNVARKKALKVVKQKHRWFYKLPGCFHAYGPTRPMTRREASDSIKMAWGLKTMRGVETWEA